MTNAHEHPPLLDPDAARSERMRWLRQAQEVIEAVCTENATVTTHLIWPRLGFPPGRDGRLLGKAFMKALAEGWVEKDKDDEGVWRAWDHIDLPPLHSADGVLIKQKALVPVYRSLLFRKHGAQ